MRLLQAGTKTNPYDVNALGRPYSSALQLVANNGHTKCMRHMLNAGTDVNAVQMSGHPRLAAAAQNGFCEAAAGA